MNKNAKKTRSSEELHVLGLGVPSGEEQASGAVDLVPGFLLALDDRAVDGRMEFGGLGLGLLPSLAPSSLTDELITRNLVNELLHDLDLLSYLLFTLRIIHDKLIFVNTLFAFFQIFFKGRSEDLPALGLYEDRFVSGLGPLADVLHIVVNKDAILADEVNLAARAYDADELLGGQLGDELRQPVNLAGLAVFVGGLGQDVNLNTRSDEGTNCGDVFRQTARGSP